MNQLNKIQNQINNTKRNPPKRYAIQPVKYDTTGVNGIQTTVQNTEGLAAVSTLEAIDFDPMRNLQKVIILDSYIIQPSDILHTPWLANMTPSFERYRFDNYTIEYTPACPDTTIGYFHIFVDINPTDSVYQTITLQQTLQFQIQAQVNLFRPLKFQLPRTALKNWLYVAQNRRVDYLEQPARIYLALSGITQKGFFGKTSIHYTCSFKVIQPLISQPKIDQPKFYMATGSEDSYLKIPGVTLKNNFESSVTQWFTYTQILGQVVSVISGEISMSHNGSIFLSGGPNYWKQINHSFDFAITINYKAATIFLFEQFVESEQRLLQTRPLQQQQMVRDEYSVQPDEREEQKDDHNQLQDQMSQLQLQMSQLISHNLLIQQQQQNQQQHRRNEPRSQTPKANETILGSSRTIQGGFC